MINEAPSLDLVEFIETQILPQYAQFDRAHNMEHVVRVIRRSLELAKTTVPQQATHLGASMGKSLPKPTVTLTWISSYGEP